MKRDSIDKKPLKLACATAAAIMFVSSMAFSPASFAGEAPPFITLNYDYSSINITNWNEPQNRHWSWWNLDKVIPFPVEIGRGATPVHQFGKNYRDISEVSVSYYGREMKLAEYLIYSRTDGFLVIKDNKIIYEAYPRQMREIPICLRRTVTTSEITGASSMM